MTDPLELLREEHRDLVIGPEISRLLRRVVRATAPTYPPTEYGASGGWTAEALEDVLQDWVTERLLARGDLSLMLHTAGSSSTLRAALTTSFSQLLINNRRRTSASNLYRRTAQMLRRDDEFVAVTTPSRLADQLWTTSGVLHESSSPLSLGELVQIANGLTDEQLAVVRYGPYSLKSSPIVREPSLRRFLSFLLENSEGALTLTTISDVMRRRFRLFELEDVELDESIETREDAVALQVEHVVAAESVMARMGSNRVIAIRAFEESEGDFAAVGAALGGEAEEGESAVTEVVHLIAEIATSTDDARAIYAALIEKLF
jgi:hypothetical protein